MTGSLAKQNVLIIEDQHLMRLALVHELQAATPECMVHAVGNLTIALELMEQIPFELVLIDEVAARAGVGNGSVYRQFRSKEELYAAAVIGGFAELQREIRVALAGCNSVREQIATIVRHALIFFRSTILT